MREKLRWKTAVLLVLLIVVSAFVSYPLLASRHGWPEPAWIANHRLRLGLDLKGGVHVVLQVQPDPSASREPGVDDATWRRQTIDRVRDTIERRVDALGIGEATIAVQGSQHDRLLIQLPGFTDMARAMGMGVDSNVLIFERIREERAAGQTGRAAIDAGFRRVFATLLDTHIAALISAAFLFQFGTSPIRGFAVTLSVGLLMNLFTSTVVSRTLFQLVIASRPARAR